jgi:hypothetical protein
MSALQKRSQAPRANAGNRANSKPERRQDKATATNWKAGAPRATDSDSLLPITSVRGFLTAREIALSLDGEGRPDASGNYATHCPCPAHRNGDRNASLSLKDCRDGRVLFYCFAGGSFREIAAALRARGLMPAFHSWRRP